jgi:hypothetical protein
MSHDASPMSPNVRGRPASATSLNVKRCSSSERDVEKLNWEPHTTSNPAIRAVLRSPTYQVGQTMQQLQFRPPVQRAQIATMPRRRGPRMGVYDSFESSRWTVPPSTFREATLANFANFRKGLPKCGQDENQSQRSCINFAELFVRIAIATGMVSRGQMARSVPCRRIG